MQRGGFLFKPCCFLSRCSFVFIFCIVRLGMSPGTRRTWRYLTRTVIAVHQDKASNQLTPSFSLTFLVRATGVTLAY
jgi:hypothetical protein